MTLSKTNKVQIVAGITIAVIIWFAFFARVTPPEFAQAPAGSERKEMFFDYFAPIVNEVNDDIAQDRAVVVAQCQADPASTDELSNLAEKYRIKEDDLQQRTLCEVLLNRVDEVPASLALAQGANESAWGTARFAQQGNNFFGQWCFKKGCGIVPKGRGEGQIHEVASFRSPADSVRSYMMNLNTHDAYKPLRKIRRTLRNKDKDITGIALSHGLNKYSERGEEYGEELRDMIRYNKLTQFDN